MKQLFINIGFTTILFAFTLNINYCKKNDTIEQETEKTTYLIRDFFEKYQ